MFEHHTSREFNDSSGTVGTPGTVGTVVTLGRVGTEVTLGTVGAGVTLGTLGTVKTKHSEQLDYVINGVPEVSGLNRNLKRTINSLTMLFRVFQGRAFLIFEAIHANIH